MTAPAPAIIYTFSFDAATLQTIARGVQKLPYEEAAPLLNHLQAESNRQENEFNIKQRATAAADAAVARAADGVVADAKAQADEAPKLETTGKRPRKAK